MTLPLTRSETRRISAPPEAVYADIADPERMAAWWAFCDICDDPEDGIRVFEGSWGAQRSRVTTRIVTDEGPHTFAFVHTAEELDGRPAPSFSAETRVEIVLAPVGEGACDVTITSTQVPAGTVKGWAMKLLGKRQVGEMLKQSLTLLAARHAES